MLVLRIVAILATLVIGSSVLAWVVTRDRRYLQLAWRVTQGSLIVALAVMALFAAERLIVLSACAEACVAAPSMRTLPASHRLAV